MSKLNDYLKKARKPVNEAMRPSDYDSPEQQKEEEEMMGEIPWYSSEGGDGWNRDADSISQIMEVLDEFQRLDYELNNARRGSYADCGDTAEDLAAYCHELINQFQAAVDYLEDEISKNGR